MKIIADSGSTKCDWAIIKNGNIDIISGDGINPFFVKNEDIAKKIELTLNKKIDFKLVKELYFYGAGCIDSKIFEIQNCLKSLFSNAKIEVNSDLLGATRAVCGNEKGIAAILGTGSNSALYDGRKIVQNTPALGFIIGDEGSGASLGKKFLNLLLKNQLSNPTKEDFFENYKFTTAEIIENVYRRAFPNRFLASFSPFILKKYYEDRNVKKMVENEFNLFITNNIEQYQDYQILPINFVGSVAYHYSDILKKIVENREMNFGKIVKSPIEGLVNFHSN